MAPQLPEDRNALCTSKMGSTCPKNCWTSAFSSTHFPTEILETSQWCSKHMNLLQKSAKIESGISRQLSWRLKIPQWPSGKRARYELGNLEQHIFLWWKTASFAHRTSLMIVNNSSVFPIITCLLCCWGLFLLFSSFLSYMEDWSSKQVYQELEKTLKIQIHV